MIGSTREDYEDSMNRQIHSDGTTGYGTRLRKNYPEQFERNYQVWLKNTKKYRTKEGTS
jgi:hypothetical protein